MRIEAHDPINLNAAHPRRIWLRIAVIDRGKGQDTPGRHPSSGGPDGHLLLHYAPITLQSTILFAPFREVLEFCLTAHLTDFVLRLTHGWLDN